MLIIVAAEYAKLPLIQPYLFPGNQRYVDGVNFASAGAGALVETHQGLVCCIARHVIVSSFDLLILYPTASSLMFNLQVIDLKTQLSYFNRVSKVLRQEVGDAETTTLLAKAVYLINIGSNDYAIYLTQKSSAITPEKYVNMVVGNLSTVIKVR